MAQATRDRTQRHIHWVEEQLLGFEAGQLHTAIKSLEQSYIEDGTIAHLIVVVVEAALQKYDDGWADQANLDSEFGQSGNGRSTHSSVLEHNAIVDEANVL